MLGLDNKKTTSMDNLNLFAQIVKLIPRSIVDPIVKKHNGDKGASKLTSWKQLLCMLFCHLGHCMSLRDITNGIRSAGGNLNHLGISGAPSRNALSHQNKVRPCIIWKDLYLALHQHLGQQMGLTARHRGLPGVGKRNVYLLDSSLITLCARLFDWAHYSTEKGAVKLHTLFSLSDFLPKYLYISTGTVSDNLGAYRLMPERGSVVVADRGYCDTELLRDWDSMGVCFVARLKKDIKYRRLVEFDQPDDREQDILIDEVVEFVGEQTSRRYPHPIRRVTVYDHETMQEPIELLTNNARWDAATVAALYKARWQIEIFFKMIKQLLRIKSFVGTSENAVCTQIWTAMIAILLLQFIKTKAMYQWHMSNLVSFLRLNLFNKIDLWQWVNEPFMPQSSKDPPLQGILL